MSELATDRNPASEDRSFGLPPVFYAVTIAGYLGFLAVMAMAVMNAELGLPMAIIALFLVVVFTVPFACVRVGGRNIVRFRAFRQRGIEIATGHLGGGAAAVQVLIIPLLVLFWGVVFGLIAVLE